MTKGKDTGGTGQLIKLSLNDKIPSRNSNDLEKNNNLRKKKGRIFIQYKRQKSYTFTNGRVFHTDNGIKISEIVFFHAFTPSLITEREFQIESKIKEVRSLNVYISPSYDISRYKKNQKLIFSLKKRSFFSSIRVYISHFHKS